MVFQVLVDSGPSDCFIDVLFVSKFKLLSKKIKLLTLILLNSTTNHTVSEIVLLLIYFLCSFYAQLEFYSTLLDRFCSVVLDHSWLRQANPKIDWSTGTIILHNRQNTIPVTSPMQPRTLQKLGLDLKTIKSNGSSPKISMVNAATFKLASRQKRSKTYQPF